MPVDYEHKFNEGDRVIFKHGRPNHETECAVIKKWHGNKIYMIRTDSGIERFAYESELRAEDHAQ